MTRTVALVLAAVVAAATTGSASGPIGVYGIVEKVVFEPNDKNPERVQVFGAFVHVEGIPPRLWRHQPRAVTCISGFRRPGNRLNWSGQSGLI